MMPRLLVDDCPVVVNALDSCWSGAIKSVVTVSLSLVVVGLWRLSFDHSWSVTAGS